MQKATTLRQGDLAISVSVRLRYSGITNVVDRSAGKASTERLRPMPKMLNHVITGAPYNRAMTTGLGPAS
jgi:hypothetical protein